MRDAYARDGSLRVATLVDYVVDGDRNHRININYPLVEFQFENVGAMPE